MADREVGAVFVVKAEQVLRRAAGLKADCELRRFMGFDTRELVGEIAMALEEMADGRRTTDDEGDGMTFAEAVQWIRENPGLRVDDLAWPGWAEVGEALGDGG